MAEVLPIFYINEINRSKYSIFSCNVNGDDVVPIFQRSLRDSVSGVSGCATGT